MTEKQLNTALANFARNWSDEPIVGRYDDTIVIRLYTIKRADNVVFQAGKRNTEDTICQRSDFFTMVFVDKNQLDELSKYVNLENLTLESKFRDFSKLQGIQKKFLSLTNVLPPDYSKDETSIVDKIILITLRLLTNKQGLLYGIAIFTDQEVYSSYPLSTI